MICLCNKDSKCFVCEDLLKKAKVDRELVLKTKAFRSLCRLYNPTQRQIKEQVSLYKELEDKKVYEWDDWFLEYRYKLLKFLKAEKEQETLSLMNALNIKPKDSKMDGSDELPF